MTIELNEYGFGIDSEWIYVSLTWQMLILSALSVIAYKSYKAYNKREKLWRKS
jgi:hypothetical protein